MTEMDELRRDAEQRYSDFSQYPLVAVSEEFGRIARRPMGKVHEQYHVIEVRKINTRLVAGSIERVRKLNAGMVTDNQLVWFNLYDHDAIPSADACTAYFEKFIADFNGAAEQHRQAGMEHLLEELQKAI